LIGFIQRPITQYSHTYKNIKKRGYYTINHVHESFIKNAHYTSAKFDENTSEFEACGLTMEQQYDFDAPFVKESKIKLGVKFVQEIPIELNNTFLVIGQIEHLLIRKDVIQNDGSLDLNLINDVSVSGLDTYHKVNKISTFPYAKKDELPVF
ncbi:flavin reductase family protein, partial [Bacteroidota bacterium]